MRHCIEKYGFAYCGVIHLLDGSPRLAFQKIGNGNRLLPEMLAHAKKDKALSF